MIKHVINDNGGTAAAKDFLLAVAGPTPSPATFPGAEVPGTLVTFGSEGGYGVTEAPLVEQALARYVASYSADCTGTLAYDETKTCTVTNDDRDLCFEVTCGAETACGEAGVCDPTNGKCTYAAKPRGTECRASAGDCDAVETCTGIDTVCPPDGPNVGPCAASLPATATSPSRAVATPRRVPPMALPTLEPCVAPRRVTVMSPSNARDSRAAVPPMRSCP